MKIIHLSAECYPAAKAGGLGDVLGALPKYLNTLGTDCEVIIPKYQTSWLEEQDYDTIWENSAPIGEDSFHFCIQRVKNDPLGFPLLVADIPGRFDRPGVYIDPWSGHGYWDEFERYLSFQVAALDWIRDQRSETDIIHCHDHHTGLIPFLTSQCYRYESLKNISTVLTIHNAEYHGQQDMGKKFLIPAFPDGVTGLLEWDGQLNPLAAGLKCTWRITTVSQTYMNELSSNSNGLEWLLAGEREKSQGILNGIDAEVWDPSTDNYLTHHYNRRNWKSGKRKNKELICSKFGLDPELPLIGFIGRLVREKGADLLPDLFRHFLHSEDEVNFVLLGTGDPELHDIFNRMQSEKVGYFDATLEYNEQLAHEIYAGSDFLIMPSRVEPCGLNQMYAMRYGTIPIVRSVGGLKDTVIDISEPDGYGIRFEKFTLHEAEHAVHRALNLYHDHKVMSEKIRKVMALDFSWKKSASAYLNMYNSLREMGK